VDNKKQVIKAYLDRMLEISSHEDSFSTLKKFIESRFQYKGATYGMSDFYDFTNQNKDLALLHTALYMTHLSIIRNYDDLTFTVDGQKFTPLSQDALVIDNIRIAIKILD